MNGGIDPLVQQGFVEFLGEQPFAALILQPALDAVTAGHEGINGERADIGTAAFCQHGGDQPTLRQRQRRTARAEFHYFHSATGGMEDRMLSTLPPVFRPTVVPRS